MILPCVYHACELRPETTHYVFRIDQAPVVCDMGDRKYLQLCCKSLVLYCFSMMEKELTTQGIGADDSIRALATLLLVAVLRELKGDTEYPRFQNNHAFLRYVDVIDNYVALHYAKGANAESLANRLGVTTRQLSRIMRQYYGCTFRQRLQEIRMYHAKQALLATDQPISQIAAACGFADVGSFSAAFHKKMGCTPS